MLTKFENSNDSKLNTTFLLNILTFEHFNVASVGHKVLRVVCTLITRACFFKNLMTANRLLSIFISAQV